MKLLLDIIAPDLENFHAQEPAVVNEIVAFVKALVKQRTRDQDPRVAVMFLGPNDVPVDADQLLRLQTKANANERH